MNHLQTTLGSLDAHVIQGDDGAPRLAVVLCHGFGAPGEDLVGLGPELMSTFPALAKGVRFIFPAAAITLPGYGGGARAWWEIDLEQRMRVQQQGPEAIAALRDELPQGLTAARRHLMGALEALSRSAGLSMGRIVLGGFSQGAMLTTDTLLALDEPPAGLAILSGTVINQAEWAKKAPRRRGLPVFQSHGRIDSVLRFRDAELLRDLLGNAGLAVEFLPFDGGHAIPGEVLEALGRFLEARLAEAN